MVEKMSLSDQESVSDDLNIEKKTYHQMKMGLKQHGYREGASTGREATYQLGFDKGYGDGFTAGEALGIAKGSLSCRKFLTPNEIKTVALDARLENPSKGSCLMCSDVNTDFHSFSLDELVEKQKCNHMQLFDSLSNFRETIRKDYT